MSYQEIVGTLMAWGYQKLGTQEAMNDMYVTQSNWDGTQTSPTLTSRNAGGGQRMPDKENFNCVIGDVSNAGTQNEILRLLWQTYGKEKTLKWGVAVLESLQQAEVLRQGVHESSVQSETEKGQELGNCPQTSSTVVAGWLLRDMRKQQECGCSPYRWESAEQRFVKSATAMPELPYKSPSSVQDLFNMWEKGEGIWLLQQTLYQIQEIWRPVDGCKGGDGMKDVSTVVRRLTPL